MVACEEKKNLSGSKPRPKLSRKVSFADAWASASSSPPPFTNHSPTSTASTVSSGDENEASHTPKFVLPSITPRNSSSTSPTQRLRFNDRKSPKLNSRSLRRSRSLSHTAYSPRLQTLATVCSPRVQSLTQKVEHAREYAARLALLLHARTCHKISRSDNIKESEEENDSAYCSHRNCRTAKGVLAHVQECMAPRGSCHPSCRQAKVLLRHYRLCQARERRKQQQKQFLRRQSSLSTVYQGLDISDEVEENEGAGCLVCTILNRDYPNVSSPAHRNEQTSEVADAIKPRPGLIRSVSYCPSGANSVSSIQNPSPAA